jgi:acyl-CoA synthetase (NDP forming)
MPEQVDRAISAGPAARVAEVVEECGDAHVGAAVVLSSGFAETGPSGAATQSRVVASARRHDIRLVGPNCIGLTNTDCECGSTGFATRRLRLVPAART